MSEPSLDQVLAGVRRYPPGQSRRSSLCVNVSKPRRSRRSALGVGRLSQLRLVRHLPSRSGGRAPPQHPGRCCISLEETAANAKVPVRRSGYGDWAAVVSRSDSVPRVEPAALTSAGGLQRDVLRWRGPAPGHPGKALECRAQRFTGRRGRRRVDRQRWSLLMMPLVLGSSCRAGRRT